MQLTGKRAIVTGSSRGIGLAIAESLLQEGVQIVVSSRSQEDARRVAEALSEKTSTKTVAFACDVRQSADCQALIEFCACELGGIDILVNNAGIGVFANVEDLSVEGWRDTLSTNLDSVFYTCHYAIRHLREDGGGFILNIGSLAGKNAFPGGGAYNASKFGLIGFSEALMQEVRHQDIQVAYIMPGSVNTGFSGQAVKEDSWKLAPEDVAEVVVQTLKRRSNSLSSRIEMRPSKPPK